MNELYRRSPGLQRKLNSELSHQPGRIYRETRKTKAFMAEHYPSFQATDEVEKFDKAYETHSEIIAAAMRALEDLERSIDEISPEEFEQRYADIEASIDAALESILGYTPQRYWNPQETTYPSYPPVNIREKSFDVACPLQWKPEKEELSRFLTVAERVHTLRVERGEVAPNTPLHIIDVGGANFNLGILLLDLAKELGLTVEYHVVDPDKSIIEQAQHEYPADPIIAHTERVETLVDRIHASEPSLQALTSEYKETRHDLERRYFDVQRLYESITNHENLTQEDIDGYVALLQEIDTLPVTPPPTDKASLQKLFLDDEGNNRYFQEANRVLNSLKQRVEEALAHAAPSCDLIINSWMPYTEDFTAAIRQLNGAAIVYVVDRGGSTGIQTTKNIYLRNSSYPKRLGQEYSYNPGALYTLDSGWVGQAVTNIIPLTNGVVVQLRKDYAEASLLNADPMIPSSGKYPWTSHMPVAPIIALRNESETDDFHTDLEAQAVQLVPPRHW